MTSPVNRRKHSVTATEIKSLKCNDQGRLKYYFPKALVPSAVSCLNKNVIYILRNGKNKNSSLETFALPGLTENTEHMQDAEKDNSRSISLETQVPLFFMYHFP